MIQKVYCGPNIPKFGLIKFQVFIMPDADSYAPNVKDAINNIPEIAKLFCNIEDLDNFRFALKDSGSVQSVYYSEIEKKIKEVN